MPEDLSKLSDHDLLITMHEQMRGIKEDIKDLKDGTSSKLTDHENRIKVLEVSNAKYWLSIMGYSAVGVSMVGLILYHILYN